MRSNAWSGRVYDAVVVLGSKPNVETWLFPSHVYASLDRAARLVQEGAARYVILSGRWALSFDYRGVQQADSEAQMMLSYLQRFELPADRILLEEVSKDTISNLFYIKRLVLKPRGFRRILLVAGDFRLERLKYLVGKILGPDYDVDFASVPSRPEEVYPRESDTMRRTQVFLAPMQSGDDGFLEDAFYEAGFYLATRPV